MGAVYHFEFAKFWYYLFIYLFITRFVSHVKSFTKWRIASAYFVK